MNNFDKITEIIRKYLDNNSISLDKILIDISEASENTAASRNIYQGLKSLSTIDMDDIAKKAYRIIKIPGSKTEDDSINTVDSFLVNKDNEWFFIEFKDTKVNVGNTKDNIIKKAYANLYMLLDILYEMKSIGIIYEGFSYEMPIKFIKNNISYILVCSTEKNPELCKQIIQHDLINKKYTPHFMKRLDDYLFKEAFAYNEIYFERKFVTNVQY